MPETKTDQKDETLEIVNDVSPPRITVKEGTHKAVYMGLKTFMDNTPWGEKQAVRLLFRIWEGDHRGTTVSLKGLMIYAESKGKWVIGGRSKLAAKVRTLTKGGLNIGAEHKGTRVFVEVRNNTSKKKDEETGKFRVYDFVESFILDTDQTPVPENLLKRPDSGKAATGDAATSGSSAGKQDEMIGDLGSLDEYEM